MEKTETVHAPKKSWLDALSALVHPRTIAMLFLGFSAGVPILLIFSTLSVWLREAGIQRSTITFFSWAALGYSFKFVWAPIIDRFPVPYLTKRMGRRRAWLLVSQCMIVFSLIWTAWFDPTRALVWTALGAVFIGFSSATQDIVIDAYRIESVGADMQSILSAMYVAGYRIGMIVAGAGALWLADWWGDSSYDFSVWSRVYRTMAMVMLTGIVTTLVIKEPDVQRKDGISFHKKTDYLRFLFGFVVCVMTFIIGFILTKNIGNTLKATLVENFGLIKQVAGFLVETLRLCFSIGLGAVAAWCMIKLRVVPYRHIHEAYVEPVADFFRRYGKTAFVILLLIGTYRIADIVMGVIANVFYLDIGFTKTLIATYTKFWGLWATIFGGIIGGILSVRYGVIRILFLGAFLAAATNILFAYLAGRGPDEMVLLFVIMADNGSAGLAAASFVAYLSSLTSVSFTAMQYAIFSSLMTLLPKIIAGYSGGMVDSVGYESFFIGTAIIGIPVLFLIFWANSLTRPPSIR